jgi:hypothetical protein
MSLAGEQRTQRSAEDVKAPSQMMLGREGLAAVNPRQTPAGWRDIEAHVEHGLALSDPDNFPR